MIKKSRTPVGGSRTESWLAGYVRAWRTDNRDDIAVLFTEDAQYHTGPFDAPWQGREAIIKNWIKRGDSKLNWEFNYEIWIDSADLAVVVATTRYFDNEQGPNTEYGNVWIIRFARNGRAKEFREWWMERKPEGS